MDRFKRYYIEWLTNFSTNGKEAEAKMKHVEKIHKRAFNKVEYNKGDSVVLKLKPKEE